MRTIRFLLAWGLVLGPTAAALVAATYHVDQGSANASDQGPGDEAQPWRTLGHAARTAKDGDLVWVGAGVYRETLEPTADNVRFWARGDDPVVLTRPEGVLIEPAAWEKVPERQHVYRCRTDTSRTMVRVDGLVLQFEQVRGAMLKADPGSGQQTAEQVERQFEDADVRRWTTVEDGVLQINLGGEDPGRHQVQVLPSSYDAIVVRTKGVHIRGFEIRGGNTAISLGGERNIVEDCLVVGADVGVSAKGWANLVRRCTLQQCWQGINAGDCPGAHVFEENYIIGTGQPMLSERSPQTDLNNPWGPRCSVRYGNISFCVFRYSVLAEGVWAGWWPDVNCYGNYYYGNVMWRITDRGVYNEYPANDSRILFNAITHCHDGITSRFCWHTMTMHNYLAHNRNTGIMLWGPHKDNPYRFNNVVARNLVTDSRVFLSLQDHYGMKAGLPEGWPGKGEMPTQARYRMASNLILENLYRGRPGEAFADFNGVKFATLADFQKATGLEQDSRVDDAATMADLGLGLYTVRVPRSARSYEPVDLVGNPMRQGVHNDPLPVAAEDAPYFWTQGQADVPRGGEWWGGVFGYTYEWPHFQKPVRRLIRAQAGADPCQRLGPDDPPQVFLECEAHPDESIRGRIPAAGSGFWSPSLPTVPGARIAIRFRIQGEKLAPRAPDGGPVVLVRFTSPTGQQASTQLLLGRGADGSAIGGLPLTADFDWRQFQTTVVVPPAAERFALFLGLKPSDGTARFGDIWLETEPGPAPEAPAAGDEQFEPVNLGPYAKVPGRSRRFLEIKRAVQRSYSEVRPAKCTHVIIL